MARLTIGQKAQRVLQMLMGLRHPRVLGALAPYGFGAEDLAEGWRHLQALSGDRLSVRTPVAADPTLIDKLDDFENRWFPIVQATLRRHHPEAERWLFLNLSQTEGVEVVVSVGTFVQRLTSLPEQPFEGAEQARALLARRGLSDEALAEVRELLARLPKAAEAVVPEPPPADFQQGEDALWAWYLEWSQIARIAVQNRRLLRGMGFLSSRRNSEELSEGKGEADNGEEEAEEGATAVKVAPLAQPAA